VPKNVKGVAESPGITEIDDFMIARLPLPENPEIWGYAAQSTWLHISYRELQLT
jgi:hypothetical protein